MTKKFSCKILPPNWTRPHKTLKIQDMACLSPMFHFHTARVDLISATYLTYSSQPATCYRWWILEEAATSLLGRWNLVDSDSGDIAGGSHSPKNIAPLGFIQLSSVIIHTILQVADLQIHKLWKFRYGGVSVTYVLFPYCSDISVIRIRHMRWCLETLWSQLSKSLDKRYLVNSSCCWCITHSLEIPILPRTRTCLILDSLSFLRWLSTQSSVRRWDNNACRIVTYVQV